MLQKCPSITSFPLYIHLIMESQNNPNFYSHHHQPPSSAVDINHHHQQQEFITTQQHYAKEHMFEKPLTPSDVGKLNRLVIPKQHAEKYFPLNDGVSTAVEQQKGMLLSFEDETGKIWWFRYSYWNSSQSYVLTKGWSRYVKDKHLDAGDVVLFERHMLDCERMFIRCRRRSAAVPVQDRMAAAAEMVVAQPVDGGGAHVSEWNTRVFYDAQSSYPSHHPPISLPFSYSQPNDLHAIAGDTFETVDNHQRGVVPTRRLRLFGVNLECPDNSDTTSDGSSQGGQLNHQYNFSSNNVHQNMMRYHHHQQHEG